MSACGLTSGQHLCRGVSNCCSELVTGSLDWTAGPNCWMTFELNLYQYVPHDLHPIRCAELSHMHVSG